jgi:arylsulfatase
MTDNGGTGGVKVFNAGMRGAKNTPWQGGTHVPCFFRWPGTLKAGACSRLAAHIDMFPTLAEMAGAKIPGGLPLEGRSLMPLLRNPQTEWPDRMLFTHIGRWPQGKAADSKYANCRVRNTRFTAVNQNRGPGGWEMYELESDPGETTDVAARHPAVLRELTDAYDEWWSGILPRLENEDAEPPAVPPYIELYRRQFGG